MTRKSTLTIAAMLGVALGVAGLSIAADESPLEKQMTTIQSKTNAIRKATRNLPGWQKGQKTIAADAEEIIKQAKEARKDMGPSEKQKKPFADYTKSMDDLIKSSEELAAISKKSDATQVQAKAAFDSMNKTCTACHSVFKTDDEK